eukprot:scaffold2200_cov117-Skeletonema_menzelii.AAC.3
MAKKVTKLICDFCHGNDSTRRNFVPKRDRQFQQNDLLEWLNFVRVVDVFDSPNAIVENAASICLSTFHAVDDHYTYTLSDDVVLTSSDDAPTEVGTAADAEVANEAQSNVNGSDPRRSSTRRRQPNSRRRYPGEESSSEEEESDEEDVANNAPVPFL